MKLKHKVPCADCPWRKNALQGYLGGHSPHEYASTVTNNEAPACHNSDYGPDDDRTAFCVGGLAVASNSCTSLWKSPGADQAKKVIGRRDDCFQWPAEFYKYHSFGETFNRFAFS